MGVGTDLPELIRGHEKAGRRFVAEDSYHGRTAAAVVAQPDSTAYLIVDSDHLVWPDCRW